MIVCINSFCLFEVNKCKAACDWLSVFCQPFSLITDSNCHHCHKLYKVGHSVQSVPVMDPLLYLIL